MLVFLWRRCKLQQQAAVNIATANQVATNPAAAHWADANPAAVYPGISQGALWIPPPPSKPGLRWATPTNMALSCKEVFEQWGIALIEYYRLSFARLLVGNFHCK